MSRSSANYYGEEDDHAEAMQEAQLLPEGSGEPVDVDINFVPDDFGIKITAVLGDSSIVVEHAWDAAEDAANLAQALPGVLIAVQEALDKQEDPS